MVKKSGFSRSEILKRLKKLAEENPDRRMTRDFLRRNFVVPEYQIRNIFGTHLGLLRAAGIEASASQRKFQNQTLRHDSLEKIKEITQEKRNWGQKYLKPKGNRFQTILIGSDIHDIECDPFWRQLFIDTAKRVQPEKVVLNGDIFDLPEFGKYNVDPREWDVVGRIKWVHKFLADLRKAAPDTEIVYIEGNHEARLLRHLAEVSPALQTVLSDLHGFTVPKLLGLEKYEVNYIAPADLATFTQADHKAQLRRNFAILYDCVVAHHFPEGKTFGLAGWNGHHHKHVVETFFSPQTGPYEWHGLGAGHRRQASFCNGEKWTNGFMLAHIDTLNKRPQFEYIDTTSDHVVIGGKWYVRKD